ncbi:MAG: hypothetical protein EBX57_00130 [Betaproteobacteria bacterium]|nr:hypothetical protein [Betaproteobacteria bacterium]
MQLPRVQSPVRHPGFGRMRAKQACAAAALAFARGSRALKRVCICWPRFAQQRHGSACGSVQMMACVCVLIVLSDGKANIDIEGKPGRGKAMQDALQQAALLARLAAKGTRLVWVDTAPRPSVEAQSMAQAMAARYMTLPYASAQRLVSLAN